MITVRFDNEIQQAAPSMEVLAIEAELTNPPTSDALWAEVTDTASGIARKYSLQQINKRPAIAATRAAYKALGKEPNRYRPSAEALCRRAVKGMGLYRIDSLVDIINIVSMQSGYSIGGFDADIIDGDTVTLGRGRQAEPFEALGRGQLNIEGLPVYRDDTGPIGTPTSDHERTKLTPETRHLLMLVNIYGIEMPPEEVECITRRLLEKYCSLSSFSTKLFRP